MESDEDNDTSQGASLCSGWSVTMRSEEALSLTHSSVRESRLTHHDRASGQRTRRTTMKHIAIATVRDDYAFGGLVVLIAAILCTASVAADGEAIEWRLITPELSDDVLFNPGMGGQS